MSNDAAQRGLLRDALGYLNPVISKARFSVKDPDYHDFRRRTQGRCFEPP